MQAWMYVYEAVYVLAVPELNGLLREKCIQMLVFENSWEKSFQSNDALRLLTVPIFWEGTKIWKTLPFWFDVTKGSFYSERDDAFVIFQADKPNYFPEFGIFFHSKRLKLCQIGTWSYSNAFFEHSE